MNTKQILTMLQIQDRLNSRVNPLWRYAGNDWALAVMLEAGELIDHIGWKWWKKQEMNLSQAQIELVDIWHFFLSAYIERNRELPLATMANDLAYELDLYAPTPPAGDPMRIIDAARRVAADAADGGIFRVEVVTLARALGLTSDDLFRMYVGKAALNLFRYENGYQDGSYIKMWHGVEDNVHLEQMLTGGKTEFGDIMKSLSAVYVGVKAETSERPQ